MRSVLFLYCVLSVVGINWVYITVSVWCVEYVLRSDPLKKKNHVKKIQPVVDEAKS